MTENIPKVVQPDRTLTYANFAALVDRVAVLEQRSEWMEAKLHRMTVGIMEVHEMVSLLGVEHKQVTTQLQTELKAIRSSYQSWRSTK